MRANRDVESLSANEGRSEPLGASLIRWKASLMSRFNSLLGHNYFPVRRRREFVCKFLALIVLSMRNLDLRGQNRSLSLYFPS
jgi:hypothetical protein